MTLLSRRILLESPSIRAEDEFITMVEQSAALHHPWVFPPRTPVAFHDYLERIQSGRTISFWIRRMEDRALVGVVNLNEPVMGLFRSVYLGFYANILCAGQGLMREGLTAVLDRAFGELGFHRVEANVQPANQNSKSLIERMGFRLEGFSPRYLHINGDWRDHERFALLAEEWQARRPRAGGSE